jgi:hypothetical protein
VRVGNQEVESEDNLGELWEQDGRQTTACGCQTLARSTYDIEDTVKDDFGVDRERALTLGQSAVDEGSGISKTVADDDVDRATLTR